MNTKYTYVLIPTSIIIACFVLWSPNQLMITDELSYYFQAQNWLGGNLNNTIIDAISSTTHTLIEGHYPPATSFVLAGLSWVSESLIYYSGLIYLIGALVIMYRSIVKIDLPLISLSVMYLFLPLIFIARTTMSEMPSLLLVAMGTYLYYNNKSKSYLWLAFITGLSLAFRETNLLLLAPMAFFISRNYIYSGLAFISGLSFRLMGYYVLKTNPIFLKEGYPFGIEYLPDTLIVYAVVLLVLLPLSPLWFTKVPRENLKVFVIGLISFLGLHLVYGYVAHVYSGYANGLLLNGRFWIPALPIFVVAMGYYLKNKTWVNKPWVAGLVIAMVVVTNVGIHYKSSLKQSEYSQFSENIKSYSEDQLTFIDMDSRTPIYRYIYSFVNKRKWSDINLANNTYHIKQVFEKYKSFRIVVISSGATVAQRNRNGQFYEIISTLKEKYDVMDIKEFCPGSNSCLNIYEVKEK